MTRSSEQFTILKAQAGDRQAMNDLLLLVQESLYRYLTRLMGSPHLAEDVLQDVLLVLCRKMIWLRHPDLLRPWAFRIASRTAFRRLRAERSWREEPLGAIAEPAAADPVAPIDEDLLAHVEELSPASRAVVTLHYLEDLSLAEVGDILEIPLGTVKSRLGYGIAQLRRRMEIRS